MATTAAPYGLKPVKRLDGAPYAGAVTEFSIDPAGNAANMFYGTVVYLSGGYITPATDAGTAADPLVNVVGVFVGCEYQNDQKILFRKSLRVLHHISDTQGRTGHSNPAGVP